jgi:hypothetical protein
MPDTHDEHGGDESAADRMLALCQEHVAELGSVIVELRAECAAATARAEKAEAERDLAVAHDRQPYSTAWAYEQVCRVEREQRARAEKAELLTYRIVGAIEMAYGLNSYVELEPGETAPAIESLWAEVREIRGLTPTALGEGLSATQRDEDGVQVSREGSNSSASAVRASEAGPKRAKSSMSMGVFLRISGLTPAEAGRLLGVSANAVNAWSRGASMNAAHFARLDELNGLAQKVKSTTFYNRRASIMMPCDGQPSIYDQWLAEAWTPPLEPPGEPAYFKAAPAGEPIDQPTETEKP